MPALTGSAPYERLSSVSLVSPIIARLEAIALDSMCFSLFLFPNSDSAPRPLSPFLSFTNVPACSEGQPIAVHTGALACLGRIMASTPRPLPEIVVYYNDGTETDETPLFRHLFDLTRQALEWDAHRYGQNSTNLEELPTSNEEGAATQPDEFSIKYQRGKPATRESRPGKGSHRLNNHDTKEETDTKEGALAEGLGAIRTMTSMATNYAASLMVGHSRWQRDIVPLLHALFKAHHHALRFTSLKMAEALARSLLPSPSSPTDPDPRSSNNNTQANERNVEAARIVWSSLLRSPLLSLFKDSSHAIRTSACACLSHIPQSVFAALPVNSSLVLNLLPLFSLNPLPPPSPLLSMQREDQILCITLILAAVRDSIATVRASACRYGQ